ncbi:MAG TPA: sialate O-acetylesterase [Phenylobacterium sp.]|nr:sialate O-acetylesterase [Phenylobacterium sp.]
MALGLSLPNAPLLKGVGARTSPLLAGEDAGLALNFIAANDDGRTAIKAAGVTTFPALDSFLVSDNTIVPKQVFNQAGERVYVPHNHYFNSSTPADQTRTVILGALYVAKITGPGSCALSGAGSGTVTEGSPVVFIAATTSLVSDVIGTVTTMQLCRGSVATAYIATAGSSKFGVPISWDATLGEYILLCEPTRTNHLLYSETPAPRTVSLAAGTYVHWAEGGTSTVSGGPSGAATPGVPFTFTLASTTSVTFTPDGDVTFFQVESDLIPTSAIATYGAAITRAADNLNFPLSSVAASWAEFSMYCDFVYTAGATSSQRPFWLGDTISQAHLGGFRLDATSLLTNVIAANVLQANFGIGTVAPNVRIEASARFKVNLIAGSLNGAPIGLGGQDNTATMPSVVSGFIGTNLGGPMKIRRVVLVPRTVSSAQLAHWRYAVATDPTPYDALGVAGQSNTNNGYNINPAIDVSDPLVDVINQAGVVSNAAEPLPHFSTVADRVGFALAFARDRYVPNRLASGRKVLLIPCGLTNTGFTDNRWGVGQDLYNATLSLVGLALAKYPNAQLKGIFFQQGEKDAAAAVSQATYEAAQGATLQGFRDELGNAPIVVGGMVPEWVAADAARQPVQDAVASTPSRLSNTGYANPSVPTVIPGRVGDTIHYDAAGQRPGMDGRYWTAYAPLAA